MPLLTAYYRKGQKKFRTIREIPSGGGFLYDVGSHMIDTLRFLFGVQGTLQLAFCAAEPRDEAVVYGIRGTLRFSIMYNDPADAG